MNVLVAWLVVDVIASCWYAYLLHTSDRWRGINGFCLAVWMMGAVNHVVDLLKLGL